MSATEGIANVNQLATHTATSLWMWASDFLIVIALVLALFLFAWYVGKGQLVALLLSFYSAYALYLVFPYTSLLPTSPAITAFVGDIILYAVFTIVFYLILRRVVVSDFLYIGLLGLLVLSFLGAGFILTLLYHVFPTSAVYTFTPAVNALFAPKAWFFWWFVAPVVGLFFFAQ